jgi:hypothetical protein
MIRSLDNRQDYLADRQEHRGDRRNDLQDRMDQNRDNWEDRRNDRWDNRDDIREDWQDWSDHRWHDHDYWHHGCWGGHYDSWWHHMWDEHPVAFGFGLTAWGMNRLNYWFGYSTYYNPYYYETYPVSSTVTIDYSQPLVVYEQAQYAEPATAAPAATTEAATTDPGMAAFEEGRNAYRRRLRRRGCAASTPLSGIGWMTRRCRVPRADHVRHRQVQGCCRRPERSSRCRTRLGLDHAEQSVLPHRHLPAIPSSRIIRQNPQAVDAVRPIPLPHRRPFGRAVATAKVVAANPSDQIASQMLQMLTGRRAARHQPEPPPPEAGSRPQIPVAIAGSGRPPVPATRSSSSN